MDSGLPMLQAAPDSVSWHLQRNALDLRYRDLYNIDLRGAHEEFAGRIQAHAEDPLGPASDCRTYLFGEFDRLGIIDVQLFADDNRFYSRSKLTPDPTVRRAFEGQACQRLTAKGTPR